MKKTTRANRSKYNFSTLVVGSQFTVKALDLPSMKNSLRFYNKEHGKSMTVETDELSDAELQVTVLTI